MGWLEHYIGAPQGPNPTQVTGLLVRPNIAEGKEGVPITLLLQVVDERCKPLNGVRVDIWHCDATGVYSNYPGQGDDSAHPISTEGQSFLRGTQLADPRGVVRFQSIYPGWYPGRTPHIHFKVIIDSKNVLTGPIFFPDALSEYIYQNVPPYSSRKHSRGTLNSDCPSSGNLRLIRHFEKRGSGSSGVRV